jgi:hypothetical protein
MRRPRRNHSPLFKAKVALMALEGDETIREVIAESQQRGDTVGVAGLCMEGCLPDFGACSKNHVAKAIIAISGRDGPGQLSCGGCRSRFAA